MKIKPQGRFASLALMATLIRLQQERKDILQKYGFTPKPKQRNRFQQFFFRLSKRLQRACSCIEQELRKTKGEDSFYESSKPN